MAKIDIMALGGLDETHKGLYVIEIDAKIYIVDAGTYEPLNANFGIQHFIPKLNYIDQFRDRVKGILLSTGNRQENGAVSEIVKMIPNVPIYGSDVTIKTVELFNENSKNWNLNVVENNSTITLGDVKIAARTTSSSMPGTFSWVFKTVDGNIVFQTNSIYDFLKQFKGQNVDHKVEGKNLLLMIDSRNLSIREPISPNYSIKSRVKETMMENNFRTIISVYEEEMLNIAEIIEVASELNRKVSFLDKDMYELVKFIMDKGIIAKTPIFNKVQGDKDEVIFFTGTITHLFKSFINVLAEDDETFLKVTEDDLIIMASPGQTGNEHVYGSILNELARHGCEVIEFTETTKPRMYPSQFDVSNLLRTIKPINVMPIKGYYMDMIKIAPLAVEADIPAENVIIADNGDKISFKDGKLLGNTEKYAEVGNAIIDEVTLGGIDTKVIQEREILAGNGLVTIAALIDKQTKEFLSEIDVQMKGVVFVKTQDKLLSEIREDIIKIVKENKDDYKTTKVISLIKKTTEKTIRRYTTKSPALIIEIHEN